MNLTLNMPLRGPVPELVERYVRQVPTSHEELIAEGVSAEVDPFLVHDLFLVMSPRTYVRDSGTKDREALFAHSVVSASWEGHVI